MKHIYVGLAASIIFLITFVTWGVLGLLFGPLWATVVLLFTVGVGVAVSVIDYVTEKGSSG